jgi:uncharacterized protein (DUF1778 family)
VKRKTEATRRAERRTSAVYFKRAEDLAAVRRAARRLGVPFTAFMREVVLERAKAILSEAA